VNLSVKEFWELVYICRSYGQKSSVPLFPEHGVYYCFLLTINYQLQCVDDCFHTNNIVIHRPVSFVLYIKTIKINPFAKSC